MDQSDKNNVQVVEGFRISCDGIHVTTIDLMIGLIILSGLLFILLGLNKLY